LPPTTEKTIPSVLLLRVLGQYSLFVPFYAPLSKWGTLLTSVIYQCYTLVKKGSLFELPLSDFYGIMGTWLIPKRGGEGPSRSIILPPSFHCSSFTAPNQERKQWNWGTRGEGQEEERIEEEDEAEE
jgi:hypothetical protein